MTVVAAAVVAVVTLLVVASQLFVEWRNEHRAASRAPQIEAGPESGAREVGRSRPPSTSSDSSAAAQSVAPRELARSATSPPKVASTPDARPMPLSVSRFVSGDVFSPSFSHEANELLFHVGRHASTLMRASFGEHGERSVVTLVSDGAANFHATASPDGRWLAYDSDRDGTRGVYIAHADGTDPQRVSGDGYAAVPRWSPDGRHLAVLRAEPRQPRVWNVWVLDVGTGAMERVSHHTVGQAWGASWFPDGHRLAYSVEDRLVIVDLRDGAQRVVRSPVRGHLVRTPAVSPDGRRIVFQVYHDGVWLRDVATTSMHRVLADRAAEEFAWSPDGARVVYHTRHHGGWALWELPLGHAGA